MLSLIQGWRRVVDTVNRQGTDLRALGSTQVLRTSAAPVLEALPVGQLARQA